MYWEQALSTIVIIISTLLTLGLAFYTFRRRHAIGALYFSIIMALVSFWALVKTIVILLDNPLQADFIDRFHFISLALIPPIWLAFTLMYSGRGRLIRRWYWLTLAIPAVTIVMVFVNPGKLMFHSDHTWGAWGWLHISYSYLLMFSGLILLAITVIRSRNLYRSQGILILFGAFVPLVFNALFTFRILPITRQDYMPAAFAVSGLALAWGLYRFRLFELAPLARETIVEGLDDGVVVVDRQGYIVDINTSAVNILGKPAHLVIGMLYNEIFAEFKDLVERFKHATSAIAEVKLPVQGIERWYELNISPLANKSGSALQPVGRLILLHDISERKYLEELDNRRLRELEVLRGAMGDISSLLDLGELEDIIVSRGVELLSASFGRLALVDEAAQDLEIVSCHNEPVATCGDRIKPGEGSIGMVALSHQSLLVEQEELWHGTALGGENFSGHAAVIYTPLLMQSKLLGVLAIGGNPEKRPFSTRDIHLAEMFAQQAAIALQNAQLFTAMERMATTDTVTGVCNRRSFMERAQMEYERSRRHRKPLSVILFDIDWFKQVNDEHGHAVGDLVLKRIVSITQEVFRIYDIIGRYGGDEFVVLLPETRLEQARLAAERLRAHIESAEMPYEGGGIHITISAGVAELGDLTGRLDMFISKADEAMYRAKTGGRNRVAL